MGARTASVFFRLPRFAYQSPIYGTKLRQGYVSFNRRRIPRRTTTNAVAAKRTTHYSRFVTLSDGEHPRKLEPE